MSTFFTINLWCRPNYDRQLPISVILNPSYLGQTEAHKHLNDVVVGSNHQKSQRRWTVFMASKNG